MYIPGGCFLCFHKDCSVKFNELHHQSWPLGKTTADILRLLLSAPSLGEHGWHSYEAESSQSEPFCRDQTMRSSYTVFRISAWAGQVNVYNLYATYPKFVKCSCSVMSDSLWPRGLLCPRNSPGKNTGVGNRSLLRGIFPTQGSNLGLLRVFIVAQLLSCVWLFVTPWTAACQASLSFTIPLSLL